MEVPCNSDERLLNQVLRLVPIAGLASPEMHEPVAIPIVEALERTVPAVEMGDHEFLVTQRVEGFFYHAPPNIVVHLRLSHKHPDGIVWLVETGSIPLDNDSHLRSEYDPSRSHLQGRTRLGTLTGAGICTLSGRCRACVAG